MRIALDIDSTLFPYWEGFAEAARRRFGVTLRYEQQVTWHIPELRPEQVRALIEETHRDENILRARPYPGAVEAVRSWSDAGHFVHVTSHRADACRSATAEWLARIGLPYDDLYCSYDKVARCLAIGIDVLIDDSPVNLQRALEGGITVATILHPWNRELCDDEGIVCGRDWYELRERLDPVLGSAPARAGRG